MDAYIARQPIFNVNREIEGYELLYRDGKSGNFANFTDGDAATRYLLSDAITLFGLPALANHHPAFVNFTDNLILNDFVRLANPKDIVVELLEDIEITSALIKKLEALKDLGYTIAIDDYTGDPRFNDILPFTDIIKVDFLLANKRQQDEIARRFKRLPVTLLAEKVETLKDFDDAAQMGYSLFQGYFFEKPRVFHKKVPSLVASSYGRILNELQKKDPKFERCAKIIHADAVMTYMLMQRVQSLAYYRGNPVTGIQHALVMMGMIELRRWIILLLARENNITHSDELVRAAYLRGMFIEHLMKNSSWANESDKGFVLGMFSLLDKILCIRLEEVLHDVALDPPLVAALLGKQENVFYRFLQYAIIYEMANPNLNFPDIGLNMDSQDIARLYMKCIVNTDKTFNTFGESYI